MRNSNKNILMRKMNWKNLFEKREIQLKNQKKKLNSNEMKMKWKWNENENWKNGKLEKWEIGKSKEKIDWKCIIKNIKNLLFQEIHIYSTL